MGIQEQRRSAILAAAAAVFSERGFHGARTIDVAQRANISKRDLYAAFPSKEDLLMALIQEGAQGMTAPLALAKPGTRAAFYATLEAFGLEFLSRQLSPPRLTIAAPHDRPRRRKPGPGRAIPMPPCAIAFGRRSLRSSLPRLRRAPSGSCRRPTRPPAPSSASCRGIS